MEVMIIGMSALFGLVVGSFLNVVILRGRTRESLTGPPRRGSPRWKMFSHLGGRSHCDGCGNTLSVRELIPIASFAIQKARCRSCGAALSWQYPLVEAGTAFAFFFLAWQFLSFASAGLRPALVFFLAFPAMAAVMVLVVSDFKFQVLPDGAVATLLIFGLAAGTARGTLVSDVIAALAFALVLAALWFFSRGRWMGFGDVKLILATSLAVGFPASVPAFLFSFWLGGVVGIILLLLGKKGLQSRISFGPFIIAGALLAYFLSAPFLALTGLSMIF